MFGLSPEVGALFGGGQEEYDLMVITHLAGPSGHVARYRYWRTRLRHLGAGAIIDTGVYFQNPEYISIGERTWVDKNVIILAGRDGSARERRIFPNPEFDGEPGVVTIGNHVHIAPGCTISGIEAGIVIGDRCGIAAGGKLYAFSHHYRPWRKDRPEWHPVFSPMVPEADQCMTQGPITMGANTGLGLNVVVMPGTALPTDCFVTAGSVVMPGQYAPNSVLAGQPAHVVRSRYDG